MKKHIIGAGCRFGQKLDGVQYGSSYFDVNKRIGSCNNRIFDYNDLYRYHKSITSENVITIGGDHSISEATVRSSMSKKDNVHVIWIDAHSDINTSTTSMSGNSHGMVVSKLMGYDGYSECLKSSNITYVGLRDVDIPEKSIIEMKNIKTYSTSDVINYGIQKVCCEIMETAKPNSYYHISVDVDVLDPKYFPFTGTLVDKGLEPEQITELLKIFKKRTIGLDIVEFNPLIEYSRTSLDIEQRFNSCIEIINSWIMV